jgi:hypothetical protein
MRCTVWTTVLFLALGATGTVRADPCDAGKDRIGKAEDYDPPIDPADFEDGGGHPLPIDNLYMPLVPGTTYVYEDADGAGHDEVTVTDDTKRILGVTCTVVLDQAWEDGMLVERTYDWFAQDVCGNVWYFGEDTEAYQDGQVSTEGSWEAGVDGARPGIAMLADPAPGDSYRQEYYEGEAEDLAKVQRLGARVEGPLGAFEDGLVTKEWTALAPGDVEFKTYAPGVGLVHVDELQGSGPRVDLVGIY